jgi:hypothetical protein
LKNGKNTGRSNDSKKQTINTDDIKNKSIDPPEVNKISINKPTEVKPKALLKPNKGQTDP